MPKEPNQQQMQELLNKLHIENIPNWTTQDQLDAYMQLQSLMFYWFRKEINYVKS